MILEHDNSIRVDSELAKSSGLQLRVRWYFVVVCDPADVGVDSLHACVIDVELCAYLRGRNMDVKALKLLLGFYVHHHTAVFLKRNPVLNHIGYIKMKRIILSHFIIIPKIPQT